MCKPKIPKNNTPVETIATPTAADASVTKAGKSARNKAENGANDIRTTARGIEEEAETTATNTQKKKLLGE